MGKKGSIVTMKLKNYTVVLATHFYTTGPPTHFAEYLQKEAENFIFIGHPFPYTRDRRSFLRIYRKGKLMLEKKFINWTGPDVSFYCKDLLLTVWWILIYTPKVDYFFGVDSLNFLAGYILQKVGKVKKTVYYTMDYVTNRFNNKLLNGIYSYLDTFAVTKSDIAWNLSDLMVAEREKKGVEPYYRTLNESREL